MSTYSNLLDDKARADIVTRTVVRELREMALALAGLDVSEELLARADELDARQ